MRKIKKTLAVVSAAVLTLTTGSTVVMAEKEGYTTFEFADTNAGEIRGYNIMMYIRSWEFHMQKLNVMKNHRKSHRGKEH